MGGSRLGRLTGNFVRAEAMLKERTGETAT